MKLVLFYFFLFIEIRTGQSSNIKTLFETLKDIITETNVIIPVKR